MTRILAVDTSGNTGILAVSGDGCFKDLHFGSEFSIRPNIAEYAHRLLKDQVWRIDDLTHLAVGIGPGKYIRTRTGIAFINGIAAATGLPVISIDSLAILGYTCVANLHKIGVIREETHGRFLLAYGLKDYRESLFNPSAPWKNEILLISSTDIRKYEKNFVDIWAIDGDTEDENVESKYGIDINAAHVHCEAKAKAIIKRAEEGIRRNCFSRFAIPKYVSDAV